MRDPDYAADAGARLAGATLTIDLDAIAANWRALAERVAPADCAAVVKADAYGLGALAVAPALARAGARRFFVAHLAEAAALRPVLPAEARLFVLNALAPAEEEAAARLGAIPALGSLAEIERWAGLGARLGRRLSAALHVDTGMSRLGLSPEETDALAADPARLAGLDLALVMSHFACADEPGHPLNARQIARFATARTRLPAAPASLANSSGAFLDRAAHLDLVRPGAALYGLNPTSDRANPMRPVIRLDAPVLQVRTVQAGESAGYGAAWTASAPTRLATLGIGYADGWPRAAGGGSGAAAWFGERRLPFVGRVSMDLTVVDATVAPDLAPGASVSLIGPAQDADAVAAAAGTIGYEVLTRLGRRYRRLYVGG